MVNPQRAAPTLLFSRSQVEALLDLDAIIAAVERGFRTLGTADAAPPSGVFGLHPPGGGFHVKAAVFPGGQDQRLYLAAKLNANFPGNPAAHGLPTIQGLLGLFDATNGVPLAVMDSAALTALRTAAATAVAVKYLARPDASTLTIVGCGVQARAQVAAVSRVRRLRRILVVDRDPKAATHFAATAAGQLGVPVEVAAGVADGARQSDVIITCTTSTSPLLHVGDVRPGTMVAAVGADSEQKSEIDPELMREAAVVTDQTTQCASIGDLQHAIAAQLMTVEGVYSELGPIVAGRRPPPESAGGVTIFDSTGLPFQDVVTAALVYERGLAAGAGSRTSFAE